jgi:hypothetical protein
MTSGSSSIPWKNSSSSFARLDDAYNSAGDRLSRAETTGAGAATETYQYDAMGLIRSLVAKVSRRPVRK